MVIWPTAKFCEEKHRLGNALDEIDRARTMIRHPLNRTYYAGIPTSSYRLKHLAELRLCRHLGYVSQGALIAAAVLEGLDVRHQEPGSLKAWVTFPGSPRRRPKRNASDWADSDESAPSAYPATVRSVAAAAPIPQPSEPVFRVSE